MTDTEDPLWPAFDAATEVMDKFDADDQLEIVARLAAYVLDWGFKTEYHPDYLLDLLDRTRECLALMVEEDEPTLQ